MHKSCDSLEKPPFSSLQKRLARPEAGFSLVEVSLSVAIIAFAFVALIGLLPAGLQVFKKTIDSTNEVRIFTDLTSMLQATDFNKVRDDSITKNLFYFDADGGLLDTELSPKMNLVNDRVYAARIVADKQNIVAANELEYDDQAIALKALVVIGKSDKTSTEFLNGLADSESLQNLPRTAKYRILSLLVTKTDGYDTITP